MNAENKLLSCLKTAGLNPTVDSFSDRKRLQKVVCLMDCVGVELPFVFSWYFRGPYSSSLTDSLYKIIEENISVDEELDEEEQSKITKIKNFLGDRINSSDYLELLASLLFLKRKASEVNATNEEVFEFIKKKKPYFSLREIKNCWQDVMKFEELF